VTWAAVERIAPLLRQAAQALAGHLDAHGAMA
jgi:IclR family acetate operon transcriptional repressor